MNKLAFWQSESESAIALHEAGSRNERAEKTALEVQERTMVMSCGHLCHCIEGNPVGFYVLLKMYLVNYFSQREVGIEL